MGGHQGLQKHLNDPSDIKLTDEWVEHLKSCYLNHLWYGTRAVAIFDMQHGQVQRLITSLSDLIDPESPYKHAFPLAIAVDKLAQQSYTPVPTVIDSEPGDLERLIFCLKRYVKTREEVNFSEYEEAIKSVFSDYDELIGVKRGYIQGFDSVVLRSKFNRIEIHIDISCGLTNEEISRSITEYRLKIEQWAAAVLTVSNVLDNERNFFPLITKLYDAKDGCIVKLGHSTSTASIKDERMRRKNIDLRNEPFHTGGLRGINNLTHPYSITKSWGGFMRSTNPNVTIPGHFTLPGSMNARVTFAIIDGCTCKADFDMIISKL